MASRKRKDRSQRQRNSQRKRNKGSKSRAGAGRTVPRPDDPRSFSLLPSHPDRCYPPVHLEQGARRVPDPYLQLGLDPDDAHTAEQVHQAWRSAIEQHPPEREPEIARALTAARDRLLAPEKVIERRLGVLRAPDPRAYGLPVETGPRQPAGRVGSWQRLLGQLTLYAILEEELSEEGPKKRSVQGELPF